MIKNFWSIAGNIAALLTILCAAISLAWFYFDLNSRVAELEHQVQAIYQSSGQAQKSKKQLDLENNKESAEPKIELTGLEKTCSDLAMRVADAYKNTQPLSVAEPLEKMMDKLGCHKLIH